MLKFLVGYFFIIFFTHAEECNIAKSTGDFKSKKLTVDNVTFHIHFPVSKPWFSEKVKNILRQEVPKVHNYFNSRPLSDVHIVVENASQSNGMATVFPYNKITLYDFPPLGENYLAKTEAWIRNLVIHEYVHVVTMDMTSGWINYLRFFFGSSVKVNGLIPKWLNEGVAVWYESLLPGQGRLNQPEVKYQVYKALSNPNFCKDFDCLDVPLTYPYGHAPYWIGGEFVKYLEDLNPGFVSCVFQTHSRYVPFLLNSIYKECIGIDVKTAYKNFRSHYLNTNKYMATICPAGESFCSDLRAHNVDETNIDFEGGTCAIGDYLAYITRDEKGRGRLSLRHKIVLLNKTNGYSTKFLSSYPIEFIEQIGEKCIVKRFRNHGCEGTNSFVELGVPDLRTRTLNNKKAIRLINKKNKDNQSYVEILYNDGTWTFVDGENKKKVRSESVPQYRPDKLEAFSDKKVEIQADEYAGYKYLSPEFFLFDYSNFANLSAINLNTRLVDPLGSHRYGISVTDYISTESENFWGGAFSYSYQNEDQLIFTDYFRSYFVNSFTNEVARSDGAGIAYRKFRAVDKWKYNNIYSLRYNSREDFISKREGTSFTFGQNFDFIDNYLFAKQRSLSLRYSVSGFEVKSSKKEQFFATQLHAQQSFFKDDNSFYGYKASFGKYFKDDLQGGYLAAGGVNNYFASGYPFPLYMVFFADLIGNELLTFSSYYKFRLSNHYQGYGMLPLFLKDSAFELGAEYAKSKFYLTPERIYRDEYLTGLYLRYTINTTLFYLWDSSISFAWSQLQYPEKNNRIFLLFDAAAF